MDNSKIKVMKKFGNIIWSTALIFIITLVFSCSKSTDNPVDKYCEILEQATEQASKINSIEDLSNIQSVISPEKAQELIRTSADYELTDSDKGKLKKTMDKLIKVAFEKSMEFSNYPEEIKKNSQMQIDLAIEAANRTIDNAKTLGEISGVR